MLAWKKATAASIAKFGSPNSANPDIVFCVAFSFVAGIQKDCGFEGAALMIH